MVKTHIISESLQDVALKHKHGIDLYYQNPHVENPAPPRDEIAVL